MDDQEYNDLLKRIRYWEAERKSKWTHSEHYFHNKWKTVFTEARSTLVFGGIGHDPDVVGQYTPQNVTSFIKTYKRQYKKYGMSIRFRMIMSVLLAIVGSFLAMSLSHTVHSLIYITYDINPFPNYMSDFRMRDIFIGNKGSISILSMFFGTDEYSISMIRNNIYKPIDKMDVTIKDVFVLSNIISFIGGAISVMAANVYENCKKGASPNPLWAFAILGGLSAMGVEGTIFLLGCFLFIKIIDF